MIYCATYKVNKDNIDILNTIKYRMSMANELVKNSKVKDFKDSSYFKELTKINNNIAYEEYIPFIVSLNTFYQLKEKFDIDIDIEKTERYNYFTTVGNFYLIFTEDENTKENYFILIFTERDDIDKLEEIKVLEEMFKDEKAITIHNKIKEYNTKLRNLITNGNTEESKELLEGFFNSIELINLTEYEFNLEDGITTSNNIVNLENMYLFKYNNDISFGILREVIDIYNKEEVIPYIQNKSVYIFDGIYKDSNDELYKTVNIINQKTMEKLLKSQDIILATIIHPENMIVDNLLEKIMIKQNDITYNIKIDDKLSFNIFMLKEIFNEDKDIAFISNEMDLDKENKEELLSLMTSLFSIYE